MKAQVIHDNEHAAEWRDLISQLISICTHSAEQLGNRISNNKLY